MATPPVIAGQQVAIGADHECFSDAGGTVPCVDGDPALYLGDWDGGSFHWLQATGANAAVFTEDVYGAQAALRFAASTVYALVTGLMLDTQDFTCWAVLRTRAVSDSPNGIIGTAGDDLDVYLASGMPTVFAAGGGTNTAGGFNYFPRQFSTITVRCSGANLTFNVNGVEVDLPALTAGTAGTVKLGQFSGGSFPPEFDLLELRLYDNAIADVDQAALETYAAAQYAVNPWIPAQELMFAAVGNSLTYGTKTSTDGGSYPDQLGVLLGPTWGYVNFGVPGITSAQLTTAFPSDVQPTVIRAPGVCILIFWELSNSIAAGGTAMSVYNDAADYCTTAAAAGAIVIACTCIPRTDFSGGQETIRLAVNAQMTMSGLPGATAIVDLAADPRLSDATDTTYFASDGVHLKAAGAAVVAELLAGPVVAAVPLPPPGGGGGGVESTTQGGMGLGGGPQPIFP